MGRENYIQMRGMWDIRHWISVPTMDDDSKSKSLQSSLKSVEGVVKVLTYPSKHKIRIVYDQSIIDYQSILKALDNTGFPASKSWWSKTKATWFQYLDEKIKAKAEANSS